VCFTVLLGVAGGGQAAERSSPDDSAAGFPARPVRLIIPFPPGGSNDIMGRYFAQYLTERVGKQVVVDNRPGGQHPRRSMSDRVRKWGPTTISGIQ
jgi:tripartite-type tricarboxylate transporter receptor subunit TctC